MNEQVEKIRELIEPIFERLHFYLVKIDLRGNLNSQVLSILADTENGITMEEIAILTHEIEDVLDMNDPSKGHYRLEISSPGADMALKEPWQFRKNISRQLKILFESDGGRKEYTGILKVVSDNEIVLQLKKEEITLPLANIIKAAVQLKW